MLLFTIRSCPLIKDLTISFLLKWHSAEIWPTQITLESIFRDIVKTHHVFRIFNFHLKHAQNKKKGRLPGLRNRSPGLRNRSLGLWNCTIDFHQTISESANDFGDPANDFTQISHTYFQQKWSDRFAFIHLHSVEQAREKMIISYTVLGYRFKIKEKYKKIASICCSS